METENSNSVILRHIPRNSTILEIGCAHGRMTRFLKEELNCTVDIVEIDHEAREVAQQWARNSFSISAEAPYWWAKVNLQYDYIICADVLEHLQNPEKTLVECKKLLQPHGSIWISIPNIGHNSVLIDLFNDKFTYREVGLLDSTHLKFFTLHSLLDMIDGVGLLVRDRIDLLNAVHCTEFNNSYEDVPPEVAEFLRQRELGEVYQFVLELVV
jgi:2-polyprenyl-3-methyl-5-hydroxy-6-metoxy-1,4-benzoquinol methylase